MDNRNLSIGLKTEPGSNYYTAGKLVLDPALFRVPQGDVSQYIGVGGPLRLDLSDFDSNYIGVGGPLLLDIPMSNLVAGATAGLHCGKNAAIGLKTRYSSLTDSEIDSVCTSENLPPPPALSTAQDQDNYEKCKKKKKNAQNFSIWFDKITTQFGGTLGKPAPTGPYPTGPTMAGGQQIPWGLVAGILGAVLLILLLRGGK